MNLLYRSCDCLISAGRFEGLPFNVMEALYCGENVILSNVKGNKDLAVSANDIGTALGEAAAAVLFPYGGFEQLSKLMETAKKPSTSVCRLSEKYFLENALTENIELFHMND